MASGTATVKQVVSGDTLVLMGAPKGGPPPEKTIVLSSVIAPRIAMKSLNHEVQDEPFGFEAREYLRKRFIGKSVEFSVEYQDRGKEFACVRFEGEDLGLAIVRMGLAKVRNTRSPTCAKNVDDLRHAEEAAKEEKLGVWTDEPLKAEQAIRHIEYIAQDGPAAKAFANFHKNKKLPAIIEFIRDGGCYRAYFPNQHVYATIMLSGAQVDGFKRVDGFQEPQAEPYALEAKYFTEIRLMNRDVQIRIEDADDYGNVFGSIIHPNGSIAPLLLRNGFAKIQDWGIKIAENPTQLREAQMEAQKNRIRKWKTWQPPTVEGVKEYQARVTEIVSGDCLFVLPLSNDDSNIEEKRLYLASIRCPRTGTRSRPDEPWSLEAKEFMRKKLIGKKVTVILEYAREPIIPTGGAIAPPASDRSGKMYFVSIYLDKNKCDMNEQLISEGLARTLPHRNDDPRASRYDVYIEKEKEAIAAKKGVHGPPSAAPKHRINELLGPENANRAKTFTEALKRADKLGGIIEYVFNGSRFKIKIASENIAISFSLGGIKCPATARVIGGKQTRAAEEFSEEAAQFARENLLQRSVTIKVDTCDRGGNFIGIMWMGKECINIQLVEEGLAKLNELGFAPAMIRTELEEAEKVAREKRIGLWSSENAFQDNIENTKHTSLQMVNITIPLVSVVTINAINDFYIQEIPTTEVKQFQSRIADHIASISGISGLGEVYTQASPPRSGEIVLAKFSEDEEFYRARVESVDRQTLRLKVLYIDFGNIELVSLKDVLRCPADLNTSKAVPFARHCALSGLTPPPDMETEGLDAFDACVIDKPCRCIVESVDPITKRSAVLLFPIGTYADEKVATSINEELVTKGLALVDKKAQSHIMPALKVAEQNARKSHVNVWKFGDIDEDSDDDRKFSSLGSRKR